MEIFEIWKYDTGQLDTENDNFFTKIKQESSGWPNNCNEKNNILRGFLGEDVKLQFSKIVDNPGLRQLVEGMLNPFWGMFDHRENQLKTSIVNESGEFCNILIIPLIH